MTDRADIHERTRSALSREFDEPGSATKDSLKRARAHLGRCPQCRAFDAALKAGELSGAALPSERAPEDVIARVMAAVEAEPEPVADQPTVAREAAGIATAASTSDDATTEPAGTELAAPEAAGAATPRPQTAAVPPRRMGRDGSRVGHRHRTSRGLPPWFPRFAAGVAAAAVVVGLFAGASLVARNGGLPGLGGFSARRGTDTAATTAGQGAAELAAPSAPQSSAAGGAGKAARQARPDRPSAAATSSAELLTGPVPAVLTPALGPDQPSGLVAPVSSLAGMPVMLTFKGTEKYRPVWRFSGWLRNVPANVLVKVGTVYARVGAGGRRRARTVYERLGDSSVKYVWWADDDYQAYRTVDLRVPGYRTPFRLTSRAPVPDWGYWPSWPRDLAPYPGPGTAPGAAIATVSGAWVYQAGRTPPAQGVSVPPSSTADRVARIPKWTWWPAVR